MMNYDQRMAVTIAWIGEPGNLFRRRTPRNRLKGANDDETRANQRGELEAIARAIVGTIPVGLGETAYRDALGKAADHVEANAVTDAWPTVRDMVEAIRATAPRPEGGSSLGTPERFSPARAIAKQIGAGMSIPEHWLHGDKRAALEAEGITPAILARYEGER
jgi:ATP-dependent DNA ligase